MQINTIKIKNRHDATYFSSLFRYGRLNFKAILIKNPRTNIDFRRNVSELNVLF